MEKIQENKNPLTLDELKKLEGRTHWAKLVAEEQSVNKAVQPQKKRG